MIRAAVLMITLVMGAGDTDDYSLVPEKVIKPIRTFAPDEFRMGAEVAIVEFFDQKNGPTLEHVGRGYVLQPLKDAGYPVYRVAVTNGQSQLAKFYKVTELPTFIVVDNCREIAGITGVPTEEQLQTLRVQGLRSRLLRTSSIVSFQNSTSALPGKTLVSLDWLSNNGYDVTYAYADKPEHRQYFVDYKVDAYPVLVLVNEGREVEYVPSEGMERFLADVNRAYMLNLAIERINVKVLEFTNSGCAPCLRMKPIIEEMKRRAWNIEVIMASQDPRAQTYGITQVPVCVILKDGKEFSRVVGVVSRETLEGALKKAWGK